MRTYKLTADQTPDVVGDTGSGRLVVLRGDSAPGVEDEVWVWTDLSATADNASRVPRCGAVDRARAVLWSGSYAEVDGGPDARFEADPRTWGVKGWTKLEEFCKAMASAGRSCVFRTHARHVLSDPPGCAKFLSAWRERGFGVLIDPASMMTEDMVASPTAVDLLRRIHEAAEAMAEQFGERAVGILQDGDG